MLSPADHPLIMIDQQSQMAFTTRSIGAIGLRNNAGPVLDEVKSAFADAEVIDRTSMNTWEAAQRAHRATVKDGVVLGVGCTPGSWAMWVPTQRIKLHRRRAIPSLNDRSTR
jgi:hypothetical protein